MSLNCNSHASHSAFCKDVYVDTYHSMLSGYESRFLKVYIRSWHRNHVSVETMNYADFRRETIEKLKLQTNLQRYKLGWHMYRYFLPRIQLPCFQSFEALKHKILPKVYKVTLIPRHPLSRSRNHGPTFYKTNRHH